MVSRYPAKLCTLLLFVAAGIQAIYAEETASTWHRFRGENGVASVKHCNVPLPWKDKDIAWQIDLPGIGNGSPIVYANHVYMMSADVDSAERYLLAYELATGNQVCRKTYSSNPHHLHPKSSYASSTPCANERGVYFSWGAPQGAVLKKFSHEGQELKSVELGRYVSAHGFGASPALFGDKLVMLISQQKKDLPPGAEPGQSRVVAFDSASLDVLWETPRTTTVVCYGVPVQYRTLSGKDALLFSNSGDGIFALDLETGQPLWSNKVFKNRCVSSPLVTNGLAIATEGSGGGADVLWAVDLEGDHEVAFKITRSAPYVPTPVVKDDLLFMFDDLGIVACVELPSGDTVWTHRTGTDVSASPVIAGNKLIGISEDGTLTVLAASRDYHEYGTVRFMETTRATPLVSENYILVRTNSRLICVGKPGAN